VVVGDSLIYKMGKRTNMFDEEVGVELDLRRIARFGSYDSIGNTFVVTGRNVTLADVGSYKVTVEVSYKDPKGRKQHFANHFFLHISAPPGSQAEAKPEPTVTDPIESEKFEGMTYFKAQPPSKERPIPYIADYTPTGMMIIAWDRRMQPIE